MQEVSRLIKGEPPHTLRGGEAPDLCFFLQDDVAPRGGGATLIEVIRRREAGEAGPQDDDAQRSLTGPWGRG